jgi:hypothetical protein
MNARLESMLRVKNSKISRQDRTIYDLVISNFETITIEIINHAFRIKRARPLLEIQYSKSVSDRKSCLIYTGIN